MAPLRCCSFNCRGWNSGIKDSIDSLDLCFIQEHWLMKSRLNRLYDLSPDFLNVSVSSIDDSSLLVGRPFGGCAILLFRCPLLNYKPALTASVL